jgi:transcriptional regulator EpsA
MSDSLTLSDTDAEAMLRVIEAAPQVRRRYHFFVWTQAYLQTLLPHQILLCGAYQRQHKEVVFEVFDSVAVPAAALALLTDMASPLMRQLVDLWIAHRNQPLIAFVSRLSGAAVADGQALMLQAGIDQILIHGVARPQRPADIESLFLLTSLHEPVPPRLLINFDLLLPHLHATYLRVQAVEREMGEPAPAPVAPRSGPRTDALTGRERQILSHVREGKSNQQIGEVLNISALTVKNHVQKILRKLGAANRAQAVARAMTLNLLSAHDLAADRAHPPNPAPDPTALR